MSPRSHLQIPHSLILAHTIIFNGRSRPHVLSPISRRSVVGASVEIEVSNFDAQEQVLILWSSLLAAQSWGNGGEGGGRVRESGQRENI